MLADPACVAHKHLAVDTIPWRFTEKDAIAPSGQIFVPVLVDGERWISDSWAIANYLEDTYPDAPSLFGGPSGRSLTLYYSRFADSLVGSDLSFYCARYPAPCRREDRAYFRETREKRVGKTLEAFVADRDNKVAGFAPA